MVRAFGAHYPVRRRKNHLLLGVEAVGNKLWTLRAGSERHDEIDDAGLRKSAVMIKLLFVEREQ